MLSIAASCAGLTGSWEGCRAPGSCSSRVTSAIGRRSTPGRTASPGSSVPRSRRKGYCPRIADRRAAPIPKAELHLHIEGTLEPELALEVADRNRLPLPYADAAELRARYRFHNLQSFLDVYFETMAVLRTEEDFADLASGYLGRARAQGVRHAEISFDPQAHIERGVPMATVVDGLWSVLAASEERYGISTRLIMLSLIHISSGATR